MTVEECLEIDILDRGIQALTLQLINVLIKEYNSSNQPDKTKDNVLFAQPKIMTIKAHLAYVNFHIFRTVIAKSAFKDPKIPQHLELLAKIFALDMLINDGAPAFDSGYFGQGALKNLNKAMNQCLAQLRP